MRCLSAAWLVPLLFLAQSAEAARISFATKDCGTPPLLGLEFEVLAVQTSGLNTVTATTVACPQEAVGSLVDPTGTSPLYGSTLTSVQFDIFSTSPLPSIVVDDNSALTPLLLFTGTSFGGTLTATFSPGVLISCGLSTTDTRLCFPPDLAIGLWDFPVDTRFVVTRVNNFSVPEPGLLVLLGMGVTAAVVRRRRLTAKK